jgi:hypothetical protein
VVQIPYALNGFSDESRAVIDNAVKVIGDQEPCGQFRTAYI